MKPLNKPPACCTKDSSWTYVSPNLKYYFCKNCKKEVHCGETHFLSGDEACKPSISYAQVSEHYWKDIRDYRKREKCNCGSKFPDL